MLTGCDEFDFIISIYKTEKQMASNVNQLLNDQEVQKPPGLQ